MRRRLALGALFSLSTVTGLLATVPPTSASFPGPNGEIGFARAVDGVDQIHSFDPITDPHDLRERTIVALPGRDAIQPAWSADGTALAFAAETSPGGPFAIYTSDPDGSHLTQVTSGSAGDTHPTWSPDGSKIAFARNLPGGGSAIFVEDAAGATPPVQLTSGTLEETEPAWSPDGSTLVYAARPAPTSVCPDCHDVLFLIPANGSGPPTRLIPWNQGTSLDWCDPDWAPDGTKIAAAIAYRNSDGSLGSALEIIDRSTGNSTPLPGQLVGAGDASWAPSAEFIAYETNGSSPGLFVQTVQGGNVLSVIMGGSDPTWRPDVADPPPTIGFTAVPNSSGWFGRNSSIGIRATDPDGVTSIVCLEDGVWAGPHLRDGGPDFLAGDIRLFEQGPDVRIVCLAWDIRGALGTQSISVSVDLTSPTVLSVTVNPGVRRVDQPSVVTADVSHPPSGLAGGSLTVSTSVGSFQTVAMTADGDTLSATLQPTPPPDIYYVCVRAVSGAGNEGPETCTYLVVYDPSDGSVGGTGWIVPGGVGSGDVLPGLDGSSKASFGFTAKYKTASSTTPSGNLNFSYGGAFKLQSKDLQWLAVRDSGLAYLAGTATIQGQDGFYPFILTFQDGASTGQPDAFMLRVYAQWPSLPTDPPIYQASGDVGGQIQIQL